MRRADPVLTAPRLLVGLVVMIVLGQRLSLPVSTGVPVLVPLSLLVLVVGLRTGVLGWDPLRTGLYAASVALVCAAAVGNAARGSVWSLPSLGYLVVLYLPLCSVVAARQRDAARLAAMVAFVRLLTVLAIGSVIYLLLQVTQVLVYADLLGSVVPSWLLSDGFNTANPFFYGSPYYRANGFFFLEPSFFSQALALAALAVLYLDLPAWRLVPLLTAMLITLGGGGFVILVVGAAVLACTRRRARLRLLALPSVLAGVVLLTTPLGALFAGRALESRAADTSSSLRFSLPLELLIPRWQLDAVTMLIGSGPGSAERFVLGTPYGVELQTPALLKLLVDDGLLAAVMMTLFVFVALLHGARVPPVAVGLLLAYAVLNSALLLPNIVVLLWVLATATPSAALPGPVAAGQPATAARRATSAQRADVTAIGP